jgi:hypothetical protein
VPDWKNAALDRAGWRGVAREACRETLSAFGKPFVGDNYLRHISNKLADWNRGCALEYPIPCCFLSDSLSVVKHIGGYWKTPSDPVLSSYVNFSRWAMYAMGESGFKKVYTDHLIHRPRSQNETADSLANTVLDLQKPIFACRSNEVPVGSMLLVSSDGAARRVSDDQYSSACASILSVVHVQSGSAVPVAYWGVPLGNCTSTVAEFEGVCLSIYLVLCWAHLSGHFRSVKK